MYTDAVSIVLVSLANTWRAYYKRHPRLTVSITIVVALALAGIIVPFSIIENRKSGAELEEARVATLELTQQLENLGEIQASLAALSKFVEVQRTRVTTEQETINQLSVERSQLQSIVKLDRETAAEVATILRQTGGGVSWWGNILIGFGSGIVASTIASFLFALMSGKLRSFKARSGIA